MMAIASSSSLTGLEAGILIGEVLPLLARRPLLTLRRARGIARCDGGTTGSRVSVVIGGKYKGVRAKDEDESCGGFGAEIVRL